MTMMIGQTSATDDGFVLEEFFQPTGTRSASCDTDIGGCTATWFISRTGTCTNCFKWFDPVQVPQRTWHFKWNFGSCFQNQSVPIDTWTLLDQTYSWSESCSGNDIESCSDTINVSHDGGSTTHGTFTFSCFADCSP